MLEVPSMSGGHLQIRNGASYLLGLDKDYKPKGVYVDDAKGMFILRW